ncbi:hypothetical protein RN053_20650 [Pantoea dispersa]|uniref:hypothetical protein n=1 Tax=Pantoea dispersa TaxID=59814 RepID=UPI0028DF20F5|nr:hypothetical protein [Pantoea dispersa]MDT8852921.1 hypothetical protein [Pantoea dispersa]
MMNIKIYYLFFMFFLFPLRTEAVVRINQNITPVDDCPYKNQDKQRLCWFNSTITGVSGSDDKFLYPTGLPYFMAVVAAKYQSGFHHFAFSLPLRLRKGTVNQLAAEVVETWGNYQEVGVTLYPYDPLPKLCLTVVDDLNYSLPEFGNECGTAGPGPDPEPDPGSCDLGGPYYLSHGSMDVYDVNGNEARVNIDVTCSQDATLTFMAPNELDLGQNIVSQITLDGQQPDGLQLEFPAPGRPLVFASKLHTIGTPEVGTFDKVYLLQATIQ